ncbi:MAG: hypothetical protein HOP10_01360 [Chitinophagaceae bacterium]|nr:hypothetical protein [Chitinophagaceae bacterium]
MLLILTNAIDRFKNNYLSKINWILLLFLVFFLNVKMPVKIAAVVFFLLLNRNLFLEKDFYRQKFIWFYVSMIIIGVINLLINITSISVPYLFTTLTGILFWLLCIGAALLNSWFVKKTDTDKLHATITLFFILNIAVTIGQLILIMLDAGSLNPYIYQGMRQKYFIGTGDFMTGITLDVSTTNAILNSFGIVYFLKRNKMLLVLLCMVVLLLTASNFTNVLLLFVLFYLFIFQSTKGQKSIIVVCSLLMVIFMTKISPQNDNYVIGFYNKFFDKKIKAIAQQKIVAPVTEKPDSLLTAEEKKQKTAMLYLDSLAKKTLEVRVNKDPSLPTTMATTASISSGIKPTIPKANIHTEPYQRRRDTTAYQKGLMEFAHTTIPAFDTSLSQTKARKIPGKFIALRQTFQFLKVHPLKMITGTGMGNFSSKLAFRATALQMAGSYPKRMAYIHNDFLNNHLNLYLTYFSKDIELHSLVNSPNSVYDQLIAEYGLAGILAFILLYLAFYIKYLKKLSYGIPLLLLLLGCFGVEYWYEQLSIVILFELLMLLNIKEQNDVQ